MSTNMSIPDIRALFRDLRRQDDGSLILFGILMAVMVMGFAGFAVDLMRAEAHRVQIQGALDSAVLAAADVDQKGDPAEVVKDYMAKAGYGDALIGEPTVDRTQGRVVSASARQSVTPIFPYYTTPFSIGTHSSATNNTPRLEVSMVLDISGSMGESADGEWGWSTTTRMQELHKGAKRFIDTLLREENSDNVSISIVPFTEQVNVGPDVFAALNVPRLHDYSHCVEMPDVFFTETKYWAQRSGAFQAQHFQRDYAYGMSSSQVDSTPCPSRSAERISLHSRNASALKSQIDQLRPIAGTAIYYGVKWGALLLDPSSRFITQALSAQKKIDPVFADRPRDYGAEGVKKILVLMSDGENSYSTRLSAHHYDTPEKRKYWAETNYGWWYNYQADYYEQAYAEYYIQSPSGGNQLMADICSAAKSSGITIYSVAVAMTYEGATPLRDCASSRAHFYQVGATEIDQAFQSIALHSINLRLTK